jgi:hypothetical protein
MSALGQKRTSDCRLLMSALPPKADIDGRRLHVRFVPKADVTLLNFNVRFTPPSALGHERTRAPQHRYSISSLACSTPVKRRDVKPLRCTHAWHSTRAPFLGVDN